MSDAIKHECGIALIRLLKPLEYYHKKYGSSFYGMEKLYLLMEKQHNRGQDGAGVAGIKFDTEPGSRYISLERSNSSTPIKSVFNVIHQEIADALKKQPKDFTPTMQWLKDNTRFSGELFLGHLRYGTFGNNSIEACHPFIRENNWMSRSLVVAGNFNLTNVSELFELLTSIGQHPKDRSDTITVLEKIGHFLDEENSRLFRELKKEKLSRPQISEKIAEKLDIQRILQHACHQWDGGYVIAGLIGHGDSFVVRDAAGIRPAFYYADDEIVVVTSERPAIKTAFNVPLDQIKELPPAHGIIIKKDGTWSVKKYIKERPLKQCSFERIYFSRGNDLDIYKERKALGASLLDQTLVSIDNDLKNSVFSFIPNTAETCFLGMVEELAKHCNKLKAEQLLAAGDSLTQEKVDDILSLSPRVEKIAIKDAKLRTFITQDDQRNDLVAHVYDITYGSIVPKKDTLVIIDDSIVRGTTLRNSILRILDRLEPKKIVVLSSAPQIRYPDCYGIDMAKLGDFIAFQAAIDLLKTTDQEQIITDVYEAAKKELLKPDKEQVNQVKAIYKPFKMEEISQRISELLTPVNMNADVDIIYQTLEGLHKACPNHTGDWYFSGDYPTPGGTRVVNRAFVNFYEDKDERAY